MTDKEIAIARNLGYAAFAIYSFIKAFPRSTTIDIDSSLGVSINTRRISLISLRELGIIKTKKRRPLLTSHEVNNENEWRIQ